MTEEEWDAVVDVHLKGHFVPTRWAAAYWREQTKAGVDEAPQPRAHVVDVGPVLQPRARPTTAPPSRASPRSARSAPRSSCRYGVKSNCIAPGRPHPAHRGHARASATSIRRPTRPARSTCGTRPTSRPLVAYLATADCAFNGETFFVQGGAVRIVQQLGVRRRRRAERPVDGRRAGRGPRPPGPARGVGRPRPARGGQPTFRYPKPRRQPSRKRSSRAQRVARTQLGRRPGSAR